MEARQLAVPPSVHSPSTWAQETHLQSPGDTHGASVTSGTQLGAALKCIHRTNAEVELKAMSTSTLGVVMVVFILRGRSD